MLLLVTIMTFSKPIIYGATSCIYTINASDVICLVGPKSRIHDDSTYLQIFDKSLERPICGEAY